MSADLETFEAYRPLLFSIAYRMLGSAMLAEDVVQEAFVRYEEVDAPDIAYPKAYLSKIVTRLCLDQLKSAKTQREQYTGIWLPEPLLTEDAPEALMSRHESISMAFLVLLENLSPIERAIFVLRDVFDYPYAEIAAIVGKTETNCRRYYHRARQYLMARQPRFEPSSDEQRKLVRGFINAVTSGDVAGLTDLLAEDVALYGDGGGKVPALSRPLNGRAAVMRLYLGVFRHVPADIRIDVADTNGAPSILVWQADALLMVMNPVIAAGKIRQIHNVLNPDKLGFLQVQDQGTKR